MDFGNIVGQREIIDSLVNLLKSNKVGHAYIFSGPKGIGKKTVARAFTGLLLCPHFGDGGICGKCPSCQLAENGTNPDFHEINPESGSSIGVEEIREIHNDIIIRPLYSRRKVYLIIDAERMTVQAQNSLLKTLEEPPSYGVIIMTASNYESLLETIRSRSTRYNFKKNSISEVKGLLYERYAHNLSTIDFIASYSDGVIGTALELAGSEKFILLRESIFSLLSELRASRLGEALNAYSIFEDNRNEVEVLLDMMLLYFRDLLVFKTTCSENILINSDKKDIIINSASVYSVKKLIKCIETIEQTRKIIKQNANYQLSIEVMLMKLQEEDI